MIQKQIGLQADVASNPIQLLSRSSLANGLNRHECCITNHPNLKLSVVLNFKKLESEIKITVCSKRRKAKTLTRNIFKTF